MIARLIAACLALGSAPAWAEPVASLAADRFVAAFERALAANRLVQAEAMLLQEGLDPEQIDRPRLIAELDLALRQDERALARFEALLVDRPDDCRLQAGGGIAALRLGRIDRATQLLRGASAGCPMQADVWGGLAVLADAAGRHDERDMAFERALTLAPDDPALLNNAGVSMLRQKRPDAALHYFSRALALAPANERARNNHDIARILNGERPAFKDPERLNNAGYAALIVGDRQAAARYLSDAVRNSPVLFATAETNLSMAQEIPTHE